MAFDLKTVTDYCQTFVGYGSFDGRLWFIGMEEGGGDDLPIVRRRLDIWRCWHRPAVMDAKRFHRALGRGHELFLPGAELQRTWNKLIEAYLAAHDRPARREDRRDFQVNELGCADADHCLLELLPLPSTSASDWIYGQLTHKAPWLACRRAYVARWRNHREDLIRNLIQKHKPRAVVMYGTSQMRSWQEICGGVLNKPPAAEVYQGRSRGVSYFALPHPRASRLEPWRIVGEAVKRVL